MTRVFEHYTKDRSRSGAHAWSKDGLTNWTVSDNKTWVPLGESETHPMLPLLSCLLAIDGIVSERLLVLAETSLEGKADVKLYKRERYQVVLGGDGHPSLLFNGAALGAADFNIVTPFA